MYTSVGAIYEEMWWTLPWVERLVHRVEGYKCELYQKD